MLIAQKVECCHDTAEVAGAKPAQRTISLNNRVKAEIACSKVETRALELGAVICTPKPEARYDRIIDLNGTLYKVQIKYCAGKCSASTGSAYVNLKTQYNGKVYTQGYTSKEIDALLVYIPAIDKVLWFSPKDFHGKLSLTLRFKAPANNQRSKIRLCSDFIW